MIFLVRSGSFKCIFGIVGLLWILYLSFDIDLVRLDVWWYGFFGCLNINIIWGDWDKYLFVLVFDILVFYFLLVVDV